MIRTLSDCGLRIGELFALQRAHLDDGMLRIRGTAWEGRVIESSREKSHNRDVPIPPGLSIALREMPVRIDSSLLFPSPRGTLWRYSNWHRRVWHPPSSAPESIRRHTSSGTPGSRTCVRAASIQPIWPM